MPTEEDAREWLAHAIANNELGHSGVLGMHWGIRKDKSHQPRATRRHLTEHQKQQIKTVAYDTLAIGSAAAYIAYFYGPKVKPVLWTIALKRAAARGAKAAAPILKEIGNKPIVAMTQGADGIWRIAA